MTDQLRALRKRVVEARDRSAFERTTPFGRGVHETLRLVLAWIDEEAEDQLRAG